MKRLSLLAFPAALGLLAACGGSPETVTLEVSGSSGTLYFVLTASQSNVNDFENGVKQASSSGETNGANINTVNGDQHQGSQVCSTNVSASGETDHLVVYSTISGVSSSICSQIQQSVQNGGSGS